MGSSTSDSGEIPLPLKENDSASNDSNESATGTTTDEPAEYPKGLKLASIVIAIDLCVFILSLDNTIIATAIPKITDEFQSLDDVAWYASAFLLTIGGFQTTWGKVYRYFNIKISFSLAILIFELGSLLCAVAPNSITLIIGRAVGGLGAAGLGTGAYLIIALASEPKKQPLLIGLVGVAYGVASAIGPVLGGVFTDSYLTWRWCFYINLPIGGVSWLFVLLFFQPPAAAKPQEASLLEKVLHLDLLGTLLVVGGVVSFILAVQYGGQTHPWNSSIVIGLLVAFFLLIAIVYPLWEYFQGERASIPPRLIKMRSIWVSAVFASFLFGAYFTIIYYLPIYFQSIHNLSATESGVQNLPLILLVSVCTISSGAFIAKTGIATPVSVVGTAVLTVASGLLYSLDITTSTSKLVGYQILCGFGAGIAFQVPVIVSQGHSDSKDISSATAIVLFLQTAGSALFVSAAQSAFINRLIQTVRVTVPDLDPLLVVGTGATELHKVFSPEMIPGIQLAYLAGIKAAFAIATAASGLGFIVTLFSSWKRLNRPA